MTDGKRETRVLVDGTKQATILSESNDDVRVRFDSGTRLSVDRSRVAVLEDKDHPFGALETK